MTPRIFLSSTYIDLADHRLAVRETIRQLGVIDVSMEYFGAREERPAEECMRLVKEESDLFVGFYAHRYGYIPDGTDISISEMEYQAASESSLPRFIYIIDDNHPWLPAHMDSGSNRELLLKFKATLSKRHICQKFSTKDHLASKVAADIGRYIAMQSAPKVGPGVPLQNIGMDSFPHPAGEEAEEWSNRRNAVYATQREVFLTHIIRPSSKPGQVFDIFIYLIRHRSEHLSDICLAEFFLGRYWENKVFPATEVNGFIGISTSAYGPFLCTCRVTFKDGSIIYLDRYIDFEMQRTGGI